LIKKLIFIAIIVTAGLACRSYKRSVAGKIANNSSIGLTGIRKNYAYIDVSTALSHPQSLVWGVIKVSKYDDLIMDFSVSIKWDWRLLASLICQESEFDADVRSVAGAYGLMQIMPVTGRNFNIDITASPENNLKAGILYINWLYSIFTPKIPDKVERLSFVLAAYNAGPGHVLDAMRLAEKNGMDPQKWDGSVAVWLLKKSEPQYYSDSVVKNGYFRGKESVRFVSEVLDRFEHYKNIIPREKSRPF